MRNTIEVGDDDSYGRLTINNIMENWIGRLKIRNVIED